MKKFDIQQSGVIRVKLNMKGIEILKRRHEKMALVSSSMREFHLPEVDKEGYTEFDFATLMQIFGPYIELGEDLPFSHEIQIDEKKLENVIKHKR